MSRQASHGSLGLWRFEDVVLPSKVNPIEDWLEDQGSAVAAELDTLITYLATEPNWQAPQFKRLTAGLGELRFKESKVQYRVIGCNGRAGRVYVLLIGCTHKQNVYDPPNTMATAGKRRDLYQADPQRVQQRHP